MMSTRGEQLLRGWLIALFSVLVAALSHSFAGGPTPGWLSIVLAVAFASMLSMALAGGRGLGRGRASAERRPVAVWRTISTVLSVAGSQLVFHGLFSVLGGQPIAVASNGANLAVATGPHAGHTMTPAQIAGELTALAPAAGPSLLPSGAHHDAWMIVGHTVAGLLTIAAILHGERVLRGLQRTATVAWHRLAARPAPIVLNPHTAPARPFANTVWIPRPLDVVHASLRHRGPPLAVLA